MFKNKAMTSESPELPGEGTERVPIVLNCEPDDFAKFISSLLGKPQTITRGFSGPFDIGKPEVRNLYDLVTQRVAQQNAGTLIQFTARVVYDDNSTVLHNSVEDFIHYNEVHPLVPRGLHLSWTFLVKFPDRKVPEKQQIDVSFVTARSPMFIDDDTTFVVVRPSLCGGIGLRINHTARTWGADIEAMLSGHIKGFIKAQTKWKRWVSSHSELIGFVTAALLLVASVGTSILTTRSFLNVQMAAAKALAARDPKLIETTTAKVDYLIDLIASGTWPRYFYYLFCFLAVALVTSIIAGIWTATRADITEPSFLALTKEAERARIRDLAKAGSNWVTFVWTVVIDLTLSVAGNFIFSYYFQGWLPH